MGEGDQATACGCCCFTIVVLLIAILPFVFTTTADTERGVVYSRLFARFSDEIIDTGGFHTKAYNADVIRWPRTEETVQFLPNGDPNDPNELPQIICNSHDGLRIDLQVSFQFFPDQEELLFLTREYRDYDNWRSLMIVQAESTIRNVCGDFLADDFQTNRGLVAITMENNVRDETAERFQAVITKLQLTNVNRPDEYERAVRNKENARSDIRLAENEEEQKLIQAETKEDVAKEERLRLIDTANTTAEIKLAQAENQREGIIDRFDQLAIVYKNVMISKNLTISGILSYISNEVFMKDITIAVEAPSKLTFHDEL